MVEVKESCWSALLDLRGVRLNSTSIINPYDTTRLSARGNFEHHPTLSLHFYYLIQSTHRSSDTAQKEITCEPKPT